MFDPLLHHPIRTQIIAALAAHESLAYSELKMLTALTDGNLASYLRSLENAHYITYEKLFEGRRPKTLYALTPLGREAFVAYVDALASFVQTQLKEKS